MVLSPMIALMLAASGVGQYRWAPESVASAQHAPRRVVFGQGQGFCFDRDAQTRVDLQQGPDDQLRIRDQLTLAAVVQPFEIASQKMSVIAKWQLSDGGRSYELGITPGQRVFFTVSSSGRWDAKARELLSGHSLRAGEVYLLHAVFVPGKRMALYINGQLSSEHTIRVPTEIFDSQTPVWIGNRPQQAHLCGFEGIIAWAEILPEALSAKKIARQADRLKLTHSAVELPFATVPQVRVPYDLDVIQGQLRIYYRMLQAPDMPYGAYRLTIGKPADMYASADIAWIRWIMNDLDLTDQQRAEWIDFLQDQQNPDGTYRHITGHCDTHAFCHATGALNALGGKHRYRPALLDKYRDPAGIPAWLEQINWVNQWGASHDIWGAGVPLASTPETPDAWCETLFRWLDAEADPKTGCWRKGVKAASPLEYVGGAFHIWPIYAIKDHPLPYPNRVVDHVLSLQREDGSFDGVYHYGGMDCVWVLQYLSERHDYRRDDIRRALERNLHGIIGLYNDQPRRFFIDAHGTESRVATLAILQAALPELVKSSGPWRNPWHCRELFVLKHESRSEKKAQ